MTTILILGSNWETVPLIDVANGIGFSTIAVDHIPGSPGKRHATRYLDISGTDVDSIVDACRNLKVDGVCVGVADRLVVPAAEVATRLGMPTLASPKTCELLSNKAFFNDACRSARLHTIPELDYRALLETSPEVLKTKLFVKPVDANSGKGMSICTTKTELENAIRHATTHSASGRILVEEYMQCHDTAVHLTIVGGRAYVSALVDRYTAPPASSGSRVCIGAVYPSRHARLFRDQELPRLQNLLTDIGLHNGLLTIQAFVENGTFYFYDPGFRLQGEGCDHHFRRMLGYDQKQMLLRFAVGQDFNFCDSTHRKEWGDNLNVCGTIWILLRSGTIHRIEGVDAAMRDPSVFRVQQRLFAGDTVTAEMEGTERQVIFRIYTEASSRAVLSTVFKRVMEKIDVLDENGDSLKIPCVAEPS